MVILNVENVYQVLVYTLLRTNKIHYLTVINNKMNFKILPARFSNNHFCTQIMKSVP